MRSILATMIATAVLLPLSAKATDVEGDVWGTWTKENSPYNVIGEIRVPPESTLVIEPGVLVNFQGHYKFIVDEDAVLYAVGTVQDSIVFTAANPDTGWHGIRLIRAHNNSQISYCRIEYGRAIGEPGNPDGYGGGIYCLNFIPVICNNIIKNNTANYGGGICCGCTSAWIMNNVVSCNVAYGNDGGGIYCASSYAWITNNVITDNAAERSGGGICCEYSSPWIFNNTISRNSAKEEGGGVYCGYSHPVTRSSILWGDEAAIGPEIAKCDSSHPEFTYCDIEGGWPGWANIDTDPLFRGPENGDFHLMADYCGDPYNSPCIDAGHPGITDSLLDCLHGLGTERTDIGAYGGRNSGWPTGIEDEEIGLMIPSRFLLLQNYPNPFNTTTVIEYQVPVNGYVKLVIYNMLGQKLATLVDSKQHAAYRSVVWDASGVSSGIYFYKLTAGDRTESKKMMLLR